MHELWDHKSAIKWFLLLINTHKILNISQEYLNLTTTLIHLYSLQRRFLSHSNNNKYVYNVEIKLIPFEICLIYKSIHHSSKFQVLAVVALTKTKKR